MRKQILKGNIALFMTMFLAAHSYSIDWGQNNDPGNTSANSGTTFFNVGTWASYDGNCGPDAYLETSGGCTDVDEEDETGWCWGTASVSANITMDPGGVTACVITFSADNSSGQDREKKSTIKVNQMINWLSVPSGNVSISSGQFDIDAQGTTADANVSDRTITATISNTKISFTSETPTICSITQFGRVTPLGEGTCTVRANIDGDDNLAPASDTRSWVHFYPDSDNDGFRDDVDVCPNVKDVDQTDTDGSGIGDACNADSDPDNDEYELSRDNCPSINNPGQEDTDSSGIGDACNDGFDDDSDEIENTKDNCRFTANPDQADEDNDGIGDVCDKDSDKDGVQDVFDNCPNIANADQADSNNDGIGDACPNDPDSDGVHGANDNCPDDANVDQLDSNNNGVGNVCELDDDSDGIPDDSGIEKDNCPSIPNPDQADTDGNGRGDACEVAFVTPEGDDGNSCMDWQNACRTIQAAINVAKSNALPQVFVKAGAYSPATPIELKAGVTLVGGFEGVADEILSTDADPAKNLTIITGDSEYPNGDILTDGIMAKIGDKAKAQNRGTLLAARGLSSGFANKVVLKGLIINASENSAIMVDDSEVEMINLRFIANEAALGAAVNATNGSKVTVNNVTFSENKAVEGVLAIKASQLYLVNTTFDANTADGGAAILIDANSIVRIDSTTVTNNASAVQGAILSKGSGTSLRVTNSTFKGNTSANGAAIYIANAGEFNVINTLFESNSTISGQGGAILLDGGTSTSIRQSSFLTNSAFTQGGAIKVKGGAAVTIENVTFHDNKAGFTKAGQTSGAAGHGGAIDATDSNVSVALLSNTFVANKASHHGGAMAINNTLSGKLQLTANLVAGNEAPSGENISVSGGVSNTPLVDNGFNLIGSNQLAGVSPSDLLDFDSSTSIVGAKSVDGIIETNPTKTGGDNYGSPLPVLPLLKGSEARNLIPKANCPSTLDQRGESRPENSDASCDAGAYEYTELSCIEDAQRREAEGDRIIKYCGSGFENFELNIGAAPSYLLVFLSILGLGLMFRRSEK